MAATKVTLLLSRLSELSQRDKFEWHID